jgi:hypothetical protein
MRKWHLIILFLALGFTLAMAQEGIPFQKIGEVQPRHAQEIKASNWSVGAETMDRDYTIYENWKEYLGPLGIKKARLQAGWAKTEQEKGVYHFDWLDAIVFDMDKQGVEPWMCLCYGNPLYSPSGIRLGAALPTDETTLEAWERWVRLVVVRYKDIIDEWEVWNEPNNKKNPPEVYADLLIRTAEAILEIQPDAKILAMSLAGVGTNWPEQVLQTVQERGKLHLIDQITYHPYKYNPDESYDQVAELRAMIGQYADHIIIRQGENGAPTSRRNSKALRNHDWTELSQAKWALRRLLGDLGRDIPTSYFAIMDMKYPDEMNVKGLLKSREDQTVEYRRPSYFAVQAMASIFDNALERIPNYRYAANAKRSLSVFGYENRYSGKQVVTIWFDDQIPSDSNKKSNTNFTFYFGSFDEPVYVDLRTGAVYEIPQKNYTKKGSVFEFKNIPIYDSPILIADKSVVLINGAE